MSRRVIEVFTDGSCHTQNHIGAWAAILFADDNKILLKGKVQNATHNRMELMAVIKAIEFIVENKKEAAIIIYTDSQYVYRIPERMGKLKRNDFITKKGIPLQNQDLLEILIGQIESHIIKFVKVKAHQNFEEDDFNSQIKNNSEVDKMARLMVRKAVNRTFQDSQKQV